MIYDTAKIPEVMRHEVEYVCGLDLAQEKDASALACLHCKKTPDGSIRLGLTHLDQWWMTYPQTHARVLQTLSRPQLAGRCILAVDATGPGLAFFENFRLDPQVRAVVGDGRLVPMMITSGDAISRPDRFLRVGKTRLIRELHTAIATRTLRIADRLPLAGELFREMDAFEGRVCASGTLALGNNPKLSPHDDLTLATAIAVISARVVFGGVESTVA